MMGVPRATLWATMALPLKEDEEPARNPPPYLQEFYSCEMIEKTKNIRPKEL